jgi:hypothetical protein
VVVGALQNAFAVAQDARQRLTRNAPLVQHSGRARQSLLGLLVLLVVVLLLRRRQSSAERTRYRGGNAGNVNAPRPTATLPASRGVNNFGTAALSNSAVDTR